MYNLLKGKKGIIFGALNESSIAWKVAEKAHEQGAEIVLTNTALSLRQGAIHELGKKTNAEVIACDATDVAEIEELYKKSMEALGGKVDFILHSIGMSPNIRKNRSYDDLNYSFFEKTLDISAVSFHKVMQTAKKLDVVNEWGSIVGLSYLAAQRTFYGYGDMAEAKSCLESIARSFGYVYGRDKNVRVNTISQSPTPTTAGGGIGAFDSFYQVTNQMSPLGNATADECADYTITLFSDLTKKVTMQNLFHDGGFSFVGIADATMEAFKKAAE